MSKFPGWTSGSLMVLEMRRKAEAVSSIWVPFCGREM